MIDERTIRQWWDVLKGGGYPVEFRVFQGNQVFSGYFSDIEEALKQLRSFDGCAIYATLNPCKEACNSRVQGNSLIKIGRNPTTSGNDIERREYILIDIDPERSAGTNSTDGEKKHAERLMREVYKYLRNVGFQNPVVADSANGYHLYYRIAMDNTPETGELVSRFLKVLDAYFSDEVAKIDTAVSDPNRIAKVIGTMSAKGRNTATRPQRMSAFVHIPDELKVTPIAFVRKVAGEMPEAPRPTRENNYSVERFDVDEFISKHGIEVLKRSSFKDGEKIILKECPFDHNHQMSAVFRFNNGAMGFKCFHNSCASYSWKDFRLHFDPSAYSRKDNALYQSQHRFDKQPPSKPVERRDELGDKWLSPDTIEYVDPNSFPFVPTGVLSLDKAMLGLTLGDVTIVSGLAGSGKTSLIDYIILNAANKGFKTCAWSGELQDFRFMSWMDQMAAGKAHVIQQPGYDNIYYAPKRVADRINSWLKGKFWLYNNRYGNKWSQLVNDIHEAVESFRPNLIVVDNLTAIDLDSQGEDKNERQKGFINEMKDLAKKESVHVILVCHPRKEQSFHMLRMESIAGSSDLVNLTDNVLIVHRSGNDLKKRMEEYFSEDTAELYSQYDTVIEIAKNRSHGQAGKLIGMYFERETRRFLNGFDDNVVYGWDDSTPRMYVEPVHDTVEEFERETIEEMEDLPL